MIRIIFFLTALLALGVQPVLAQDTPSAENKVVTKLDGQVYVGKILSDDGREVLIETEALGKIYIPKSEIKSIADLDASGELKGNAFFQTGPFTTRYAFTTNAFPVKQGESYALINLYGPEVHFALTDQLNVGMMSTWIGSPLALALKWSPSPEDAKVKVSAGALIGNSGYLNNFKGGGGLYFANFTTGNRQRNLTLSVGYGTLNPRTDYEYYDAHSYVSEYGWDPYFSEPYLRQDEELYYRGPLVSVAGIVQVGERVSFVFDSMFGKFQTNRIDNTITENQITGPTEWPPLYSVQVTKDEVGDAVAFFVMPGMRIQRQDNRAFQFTLTGIGIVEDDEFDSIPFPMATWFFAF
jgi:hypothetical protein